MTIHTASRSVILGLALASLLLSARFVQASPGKPAPSLSVRFAQADQGNISRGQAAEIAQQRLGGRVLNVKRTRDGQGWQVKLLMDGERVRDVVIDARTGQIR